MVQSTDTGCLYLTDLGSRNGTLVNQKRVSAPVLLQPGDRIMIGAQEIEFHGRSASQAGQTAFGETMLGVIHGRITVLVTDIRDFTGLSRRLGEARLSEAMSSWFRKSGALLTAHGAREQKYIGDAIMAFWIHDADPPVPRELIPVFQSLQGILEVVDDLQKSLSLSTPIRIGAGLNTGLACVGNIGSAAAADYTAVSDAVNLAFRFETASKGLGCDVVLGPETHKILSGVDGAADLFELRLVPIKGYTEPLEVYGGKRGAVDRLVDALQRDCRPTSQEKSPSQIKPAADP